MYFLKISNFKIPSHLFSLLLLNVVGERFLTFQEQYVILLLDHQVRSTFKAEGATYMHTLQCNICGVCYPSSGRGELGGLWSGQTCMHTLYISVVTLSWTLTGTHLHS